jgi:hypothetical protein
MLATHNGVSVERINDFNDKTQCENSGTAFVQKANKDFNIYNGIASYICIEDKKLRL